MKLAYRITTPILAVGAIAMGVFLKLFSFVIGGLDDSINSLVQIAQALGVETNYEFSAYEIIQMLVSNAGATTTPKEGEEAKTLMDLIAPLLPQLIAFFVTLIIIVGVFVAIAFVAGLGKKRKTVVGLSVAGIVLTFVSIFISNSAFEVITSGQISLNELMSIFSDGVMAQLLTLVVSVEKATLSAGFYALFGMFILIIMWSVLAEMLINDPAPTKRHKTHRRKRPIKSLAGISNSMKSNSADKKKAKQASKK